MSQWMNVRIRLKGGNEFKERFPATSVNDAIELAQTRYPNAQHISWVGSAMSPQAEADNKQFMDDLRRKTNENNERVFGQSGRSVNDTAPVQGTTYSTQSSSGGVSGTVSNVAGMGLVGGGFVVLLILGFLVMFFPLVTSYCTGKFAYKCVRKLNLKVYWTILISLCIGASSGVAAFQLQQNYMPEVSAQQVEWVEQIKNGVVNSNEN